MKEVEDLTHPGDFGRSVRLIGAVRNIRGITGKIFVGGIETMYRVKFIKGGIEREGEQILEQFGILDPRVMLRNLQKQDPYPPGEWRKVHVKRDEQEEEYEFFNYGDMLDIKHINREHGSIVVLRFEFPEVDLYK